MPIDLYDWGRLGRLFFPQTRSEIMGREEWLATIPAGIWKMKYGDLIEIKEMDDDHLGNTIRILERWACDDSPKYRELVAEQARREKPVQSLG